MLFLLVLFFVLEEGVVTFSGVSPCQVGIEVVKVSKRLRPDQSDQSVTVGLSFHDPCPTGMGNVQQWS